MTISRVFALTALLLLSSGCFRHAPTLAEPSELAAGLASPNRLDLALAESPQGWLFSALFERGSDRLPLMILVQAEAAPQGKTSPATADSPQPHAGPASLKAMLLTETGIGLCALSITPEEVVFLQSLPSGRIDSLCERAGAALRRTFLHPQPEARSPILSPLSLGYDTGTEKIEFVFTRDGILEEKRKTHGWSGLWRAEYTAQAKEGAYYVPERIRYVEGSWSLRLARVRQ